MRRSAGFERPSRTVIKGANNLRAVLFHGARALEMERISEANEKPIVLSAIQLP